MADIRGGVALVREVATGTVDGTNLVFGTTKRYLSGTLSVELNGQKLIRGSDFVETTDMSFTMSDPPLDTLGYVDKLTVEYEQK